MSIPDGHAARRLAAVISERGLAASIRQTSRGPVLTARNPAAPGTLCQQVALVRDRSGADVFAWLFEGTRRGTWELELLGPAGDIDRAADLLARVIAAEGSEPSGS